MAIFGGEPLAYCFHFLRKLIANPLSISSIYFILLFHFPYQGNAIEKNLGAGLARLAKTDQITLNEWQKLTVDNEAILPDLETIANIAGDFQDSTENSEMLEPGYLCGIFERLFASNIDLEEFTTGLLASYNVEDEEIERLSPSGSRSPNDNTLDTSVINAMQNSVIQMSPYYTSRGNLDSGNVGGRRPPRERYNICDLTDGFIYLFKNELLDYPKISKWIWDQKDLIGEVLIYTDHPKQIRKTIKVAYERLMDARKDLKGYAKQLVNDIIFQKDLEPVKYPQRLPQLKTRMDTFTTTYDELKEALVFWCLILAKISDAIRNIQHNRAQRFNTR
ncbi:hypothetical protein H072_11566 [Dactylellina haptotyla CBS 200.50]|uniref:Uncharacterized protein n=1 Tax=Dactylellina haptotyla (strain CBS 200.50) TaxID=1284197 RepID=S8A1V2_DACHA|nr:hypothetical protein H072_11566 [Dactylellina haptotyla CBS 200.50]